jgi:hypothetical protein
MIFVPDNFVFELITYIGKPYKGGLYYLIETINVNTCMDLLCNTKFVFYIGFQKIILITCIGFIKFLAFYFIKYNILFILDS